MSERVTAEFTFAYDLAPGMTAADMDCRASASVSLGSPAQMWPWPGYPADPPEIEDFDDIEVEAIGDDRKRHWCRPDSHLEGLILAWLWSGKADQHFLDAAHECSGPDADYLRDRRRDDALVGL